jgi:uncharacterized repeat protein (TIGR01451 family)
MIYYFGAQPAVNLEKQTNGFDADTGNGPLIKVGEKVTWTYVVTNTGNVGLTGISVVDNIEGSISCPATTLAAGESLTCTLEGTAVEGQYSNLGSVTANPEGGFAQVNDSDPSHYFGSEAGVAIKKLTNGVDIDQADPPYILVGDPVSWTYVVTNVGNLGLTGVVVSDSDTTLAITCPGTTLAPAASMTCTASGTAIAGAYSNTGYVEGTPSGFTEKVGASDVSGYFGADPQISITKYTNGQDAKEAPGPYIPVGEAVTFTYQVSNTETAFQFTNIVVTDDSGLEPVCPKTTLNPGENMVCQVEGMAAVGQQSSAGKVNAKAVVQATQVELGAVQESDTSHYFGYTLGLALEKRTNGQVALEPPGPGLSIDSVVTWMYIVTNTSNVPLTEIAVIDDPEGAVTCPASGLAPAATLTCSATGIVQEGEYSNTAWASAKFNTETVESLVAISHYVGVSGFSVYLPLILR